MAPAVVTLILALLLAPAATAGGSSQVLVVKNAERLEALAAMEGSTVFAVASKPPVSRHGRPCRHSRPCAQADSVRLAAWSSVAGTGSASPGSPRCRATWRRAQHFRPSHRAVLGRTHRAGPGKSARVRRDEGPRAAALAASGRAVYVARNGERVSGPGRVAPRLERLGGWSREIRVGTGTAPSLSFLALHAFAWLRRGLSANPQGVWAAATFAGRVQMGGRRLDSPRPADLPVQGDFAPAMRQRLQAMLHSQPLPPVPALLVLHADPEGKVRWTVSASPAAVRLGDAAGGGLDPARVEGGALTVDGNGNAYLLGRYTYAVQVDTQRIQAPEDDPRRCFVASWQSDGSLRWLVDLACAGTPLGLSPSADDTALVAVTEHEAMTLSVTDGHLIARRALPRGEAARGPGIRWTHAVLAGRWFYLGGIMRGTITLAGRWLVAPQGAVVVLRLPWGMGS